MSIPYQGGFSPQLLLALFLHCESYIHSAERAHRPTDRGRSHPSRQLARCFQQCNYQDGASKSVVVGDGYPSLQWLISLFPLFFLHSGRRQSDSLPYPLSSCSSLLRPPPNAFLSSTRRLRSRTTGSRRERARTDFPWRHPRMRSPTWPGQVAKGVTT